MGRGRRGFPGRAEAALHYLPCSLLHPNEVVPADRLIDELDLHRFERLVDEGLGHEPLAAEEVVGVYRLEARQTLERAPHSLGHHAGRGGPARETPRLLARELEVDHLACQLGLDFAQVAPAGGGAGGDVDFTNERYWMLETIREFALQELVRRDEADDAGERHTAFFPTSAAELLAPVGRPTTDEQRERFIADQANFRAAHSRTLDAGDGARAVLFVRRIPLAAWVAGMPVADWYARALASLAIPGATKEDRAYALVRASYGASLLGELSQARQLLSETEALFDELCDQRGLADALRWRSEVEDKAGEYVLAAALAERVTAIGEAIGDDDIAMMGKSWLFNPLFSRAVVDGDRQAAERAYALAEAGLKYETEKSDSSSLERAAALSTLAGSLFALGEYAKSITTAQRSLRDMPSPPQWPWVRDGVGHRLLGMCRWRARPRHAADRGCDEAQPRRGHHPVVARCRA